MQLTNRAKKLYGLHKLYSNKNKINRQNCTEMSTNCQNCTKTDKYSIAVVTNALLRTKKY